MIIDAHHHLEGEKLSPENLLRLMDAAGVSRVVLFGSPCEIIPSVPQSQVMIFKQILTWARPLGLRMYEGLVRDGRISAGMKKYVIYEHPDNRPVADVAAKHPDRFIPFAFLNPSNNPRVVEEFDRLVDEEGFRGLKVHAWWHKIDLAGEFLPLARRCEERGLPVIMHLGGGRRSGNIEGLVRACPRLKVILAHLAVPFFAKKWPLVKKKPNLFVDTSGHYVDQKTLEKALAYLGPAKLVFGTDAPYWPGSEEAGPYGTSVDMVRRLRCSEADRERIMGKNFEALLT